MDEAREPPQSWGSTGGYMIPVRWRLGLGVEVGEVSSDKTAWAFGSHICELGSLRVRSAHTLQGVD